MLYSITDDCILCGTCIEECPYNAIEENGNRFIIKQDECTKCGDCIEICPTEAIIDE
ncbi:MAG: 4Fe-4S binding protein [Thermodesulfobacteriota bacterium]|nr:4Fe-4S binding protein [Thermodesulfobacteriota bacterium]